MNSTSEVRLEPVARMYCPVCEQKMDTSAAKALSEGSCPSCGEKVTIEGKIGAYRVLRQLGRGGMGAVYEGFDEGLGRKVAIKVTLLDVTRDTEMMTSFKREAQVVAKLNHPNIVQVYAFGEEKGHPYLIMELLPSGSLMDLLKGDEPISETFLMGVAYEIAEGLNAAQDAGLLHGDIKPENILFDDKMHAKLVDFGIAAMQVSKNSYEVWGTPFYIAPEKVLERKSNHKCDIYSLGATLYHALAGHPPFDGTDPSTVIRAAIDGKAKPLTKFRPDISPEIESIISRMMEKDTAIRYPNYKSLMSDIKKYLSTVPHQRLRRTSRIVTGGVKKIRTSTRKIVVPNKPLVPSATGSVPVKAETQPVSKPVLSSGTRFMTLGLVSLLLILLIGVFFCAKNCRREEQKAVALQTWAIDKQYCKVFRVMTEKLSAVEAFIVEAQALIKAKQDQLDAQKIKDDASRKLNEELSAYQKRAQTLLNEAIVIRNHAELAKLDPLPPEAMNAKYLAEIKLGLEKQREYAQTMIVKGEEARTLLAEVKDKAAVIAQAVAAKPLPPPKLLKELARGSGHDFTSVKFLPMKELHEFRMNEKDLLILAIWSPEPGVESGAEVSTLVVTRREGGRAVVAGTTKMYNLGSASLMGLSTLSQFPVMEATGDSQVGGKSNEWVVASMPNITFKKSSTQDLIAYKAAGTPESQAGEKRLYASAFVFEARLRGTYSLDGQMVLQALNDKATVSWMVWIARRE
jgi:serine/threonine protein kinase